jgi:glycosyltransferase involved in cell wall biosynthesis
MWLAEWPIASLIRNGYFVESLSLFDVLEPNLRQQRILAQADIIFYERHVDDDWLNFFDWATTNKRFYLMLDDAYWEADPIEKTHHYWFQNDRLKKLNAVVASADGVVVPSRKLARHFPNGIFKPNRPDFLDPSWSVSPLFDENVIFWGGTSGHISGMREHPCLDAVGRLVKEGKARFIAAPGSPELKEVIESKVGSYTSTGFLRYSEWLKILSGATISICPIGDGYDEYRSWIKALESSAVGTVWVGSEGGVYEDAIGGIEVNNSKKSWYECLKWLLKKDEARSKLREDGLEWAWQQGLDDHLDEWESIFDG